MRLATSKLRSASTLTKASEIGAASIIRPDADLLRELRRNFAMGGIRQACFGCEWQGFCTAVADAGYDGVLVGSSAAGNSVKKRRSPSGVNRIDRLLSDRRAQPLSRK